MIEDRIKSIFCNIFQLSVLDITDTTSRETVDKWDSLQHLNLVISLEEEFKIELDIEEIEGMSDFPKVCQIVSMKMTG